LAIYDNTVVLNSAKINGKGIDYKYF
jgi:hypothetical protein